MEVENTHPSLSNAVKQASIAEPFGSSITIGGVGESILTEMSAYNQILYRQECQQQQQQPQLCTCRQNCNMNMP